MLWWLPVFLTVALLEWIATGKRWHRVRIITKPLSLLILIAGFSLQGGWQGIGLWFGIGLLFSLSGDIFLLLRPHFFIAGLISFLLAHIAYIIAFWQGQMKITIWIILPMAAVIFLVSMVCPRVIRSLQRKLENRHLIVPVLLYMITIITMLFSAQLTWFQPAWVGLSALSASLGAFLFTISDSALAYGRFSHPFRFSNFFVMFTYHTGQLGIILGALMRLQLI